MSRAEPPCPGTSRAARSSSTRSCASCTYPKATGLVLAPGGHVEPGDRTLLATALHEVREEAGRILLDDQAAPGRGPRSPRCA
ncbi:NUDIX domain-containing protein [Streptomyces sp. NPDC058683]|uniref:NUDIX domain-containing protein n=1 Tax=Streptomyces sp. NPDC058683 TaxID=3346597 RepID=UPI00364EF9D5